MAPAQGCPGCGGRHSSLTPKESGCSRVVDMHDRTSTSGSRLIGWTGAGPVTSASWQAMRKEENAGPAGLVVTLAGRYNAYQRPARRGVWARWIHLVM
jgi:hypothetical protein